MVELCMTIKEVISKVYGTEKEFLFTIPDGIERDSRMKTSGKCKQ